ncbi:DUF2254 domain-containing protein [Bacillus sp. BGMRC 2118]|nr:DUF2254 domain-containing protein [Bacillus sp. BGMRC 2118]
MKLWLKIRSSIWYIPFIYSVISTLLAILSFYADDLLAHHPTYYDHIPIILLADIDLALTVLSSIATSLLTMTTITFSSIMIVLTTFLSQFSPRTLQNFITDPSTQRVLGIFISGFIYSIILLLLTRETDVHQLFITPTLAVIYVLVCLIFFVFFIHHVSSWIQVSNLIFDITTNTLKAIHEQFKDKKDVTADAPWDDWEYGDILSREPHKIYAKESGYIQLIDKNELLQLTQKDEVIVRVEKRLGELVDIDTPILSVWKTGQVESSEDYLQCLTLGKERAPIQDIEFGITKLVEIALRAISPATNDPNTAINCIAQLGKILTVLGTKNLPKAFINDGNRNLRIILQQPDYGEYLYKAFYQIRLYGKSDISIITALFKALLEITERNDAEIKKEVWCFAKYIVEGLQHETLLSLDKRYLNEKLKTLAKKTSQKEELFI